MHAGINARDNGNDTALSRATDHGHYDIVKTLIDKGASADTTGRDGMTPLALAAQEGRTDLMRLLFVAGARLDARDDDGDTPLIAAVKNEHYDAVALLLEWGADLKPRNNDNEDAIDIAQNENSDTDIENLLRKEKNRRTRTPREGDVTEEAREALKARMPAPANADKPARSEEEPKDSILSRKQFRL